MKSTYSVTQAQTNLPSLIRRAEGGEPVRILRRNETVAYLISRERMEAIVETMEILSSAEAMKAVAEHRVRKTKLLPLKALDDASA